MANVKLTVILVVAGFLLLLVPLSCTTVPAGHVGVPTTFGKVGDVTLKEGMEFVWPWKRVHKLSIRTQEAKEEADAPTSEGLTVHVEASLLFSLDPEKARDIFQSVGDNYVEVLVQPVFRSAIRGVTVKHTSKDLYTAGRAAIERELEKTVGESLSPRGVRVEGILLRSVQLPPVVKNAIEAKLAADQQSQQMEFVLQKEKQEAERRRVEAKGIADSQKIIQATLDENYLRYLWIKALETSEKNGATLIYVPVGNDGMPLFKNVDQKKP